MKYCILKFSVTYEDGNGTYGQAPFRGPELDHESLVQFIKSYFAGAKEYDDEDVIVEVQKVYENPQEWLSEVRNWATFKYLRGLNNFAGDLMAKHYPNE